jgi:hypothetical protein
MGNLRGPIREEFLVHLEKTSINRAVKDLKAETRRIDENIYPAVEYHQKFG